MVFVLLSPAKTLDFEVRRAGLKATKPHFQAQAGQLVAVAATWSPAKLQKLMGISPKLAALNRERFTAFAGQPKAPAILAYRGDVYQGLNADDLSDADLQWSQDHIGMLSGLYGLLQPLDAIQAYRLEMGIAPVGKYKSLYNFWGDTITARINALVKKHKLAAIIGCVSQEYLKAVRTDALDAPFIQCDFKEMKNGQPQIVALFAKKARGMMARYVIENRVADAKRLQAFDYAGYAFDKKLSTDTRFVFVR